MDIQEVNTGNLLYTKCTKKKQINNPPPHRYARISNPKIQKTEEIQIIQPSSGCPWEVI